MSTMTLQQMQLAVCEKLPELIDIDIVSMTYPTYWWTMKGTSLHQIDWPTEGLQVCHEAEKLLDDMKQWRYRNILMNIVYKGLHKTPLQSRGSGAVVHATYEQRLEALCRVWFPDKFL